MDNNASSSTNSSVANIKSLAKLSEVVEEAKKKDDKILETCKDLPASSNAGKTTKISTAEKKVTINDEKMEEAFTELLGSVTTHTYPGIRTSARVIQKMKLDSTRPTTPPPTTNDKENKKDEKSLQKTPSQLRPQKTSWSNMERNYFFDGLNEFGKNFEAIGNYINAKLKRKSSTDISYKTKDQIRQHYYQTYHKICKYVRFSEEIKKIVQELYTLINYGEMRRKLQFVTDKHFMKLKLLICKGHITVRCKGKNIRVKTPSCRALRKLNQLDDSLEDIRLPSKIEVIVSPANMESFGRVQSIAQNPRVRTTVPLHKKLINFIKTFETKWQIMPRLTSQLSQNNEQNETPPPQAAFRAPQYYQDENEICFLPKPNVTIHRPLLSITEYLSSVNLCLAAYEERMGIQIKSETLCMERFVTPAGKRQRTESGSEKRSPETKKSKPLVKEEDNKGDDLNESLNEKDDFPVLLENVVASTSNDPTDQVLEAIGKSESSGDELNEEQNTDSDSLTILKEEPSSSKNLKEIPTSEMEKSPRAAMQNQPPQLSGQSQQNHTAQQRSKRTSQLKPIRSSLNYKPLLNDEVIKRIRKGWTVSNAADITIGDLYVVLGQDSRLELDYYWKKSSISSSTSGTTAVGSSTTQKNLSSNETNEQNLSFKQNHSRLPYNPNDCDDTLMVDKVIHSSIGNKLKHLLLIANLSERIRKRNCSCGHICERNNSKPKMEREYSLKSSIYNRSVISSSPASSNSNDNALFRQPYPPVRRPIICPDPVKQLPALSRQKISRQVLVQRVLLPGAAGTQLYDVLDSRNLPYQKIDSTNGPTSSNVSINSPSSNNNNNNDIDNLDKDIASILEENAVSSNTEENEPDNYKGNDLDFNESPKNQEDENFDAVDSCTNDVGSIPERCIDSSSCLQTPNHLFVSSFDEGSSTTNSIFNGLFSPMHFFRDSASNNRFLEENFNDFSLTSLLGHLDEISSTREPLSNSSNLSVISESSVDYRHKFQEISALMQNQDKDKSLDD